MQKINIIVLNKKMLYLYILINCDSGGRYGQGAT